MQKNGSYIFGSEVLIIFFAKNSENMTKKKFLESVASSR